MTDPTDLDEVRKRHPMDTVSDYVRTGDRDLEDICSACNKPWPCDAIQLADEVERLRNHLSTDPTWSMRMDLRAQGFEKENCRLRKALGFYGEHQDNCILLYWEGCDPVKGHRYRGKWYPKELPPCGCGLSAALEGKE